LVPEITCQFGSFHAAEVRQNERLNGEEERKLMKLAVAFVWGFPGISSGGRLTLINTGHQQGWRER